MSLSDRAAVVGPYLQQLLYDRAVQDAIRRSGGAARDSYARARRKGARQAVKDKKLQRQLQQAVGAGWEAWCAVSAPRRKSRWRFKLIALSVGGAAVLLAVNAPVRQRVLNLLSKRG